jgi:hypothetical protein
MNFKNIIENINSNTLIKSPNEIISLKERELLENKIVSFFSAEKKSFSRHYFYRFVTRNLPVYFENNFFIDNPDIRNLYFFDKIENKRIAFLKKFIKMVSSDPKKFNSLFINIDPIRFKSIVENNVEDWLKTNSSIYESAKKSMDFLISKGIKLPKVQAEDTKILKEKEINKINQYLIYFRGCKQSILIEVENKKRILENFENKPTEVNFISFFKRGSFDIGKDSEKNIKILD